MNLIRFQRSSPRITALCNACLLRDRSFRRTIRGRPRVRSTSSRHTKIRWSTRAIGGVLQESYDYQRGEPSARPDLAGHRLVSLRLSGQHLPLGLVRRRALLPNRFLASRLL